MYSMSNNEKTIRDYIRNMGKGCSKPGEEKEEICLIREFFAHQEELPESKRTKYCHISCPCSRCRPGRLTKVM